MHRPKPDLISQTDHNAVVGRVPPVLHLDPVVAAAGPIDALTMLGDQALKPHRNLVRLFRPPYGDETILTQDEAISQNKEDIQKQTLDTAAAATAMEKLND